MATRGRRGSQSPRWTRRVSWSAGIPGCAGLSCQALPRSVSAAATSPPCGRRQPLGTAISSNVRRRPARGLLVSQTSGDGPTFDECHVLPWWLRRSRICRQCWRPGFYPWVGKIPWRRAWQPTPVFLPGNPMDREAWRATVHGVTESDTTDVRARRPRQDPQPHRRRFRMRK